MFTQDRLQELLDFEATDAEVVSLYINTDFSQESAETIKLRVKAMLKEIGEAFEADAAKIESYLEFSFEWTKPGLAIFSSAPHSYFRTVPASVSFRNRVRTGTRPYVKPLAHLLDHYAYYGVILVDRVGARFFEYHLGEVQSIDSFMGEEVRKLKSGGGSSSVGTRGGTRGVDGGSRHEEEVAQHNMRSAAQIASRFYADKPIRRLFLGGTAQNVAQFRELLTKKLQSCIAGTFAMDMAAGEHTVRKQALDLLQKSNNEREVRLVQELITAQAKGGNAVIGLDDTLQAVTDRRVQTLIVGDDMRYPGYVDEPSGFVVANLARSPYSDQELQEVSDIVDRAIALTMNQGGHVEVISDNVQLEAVGRIGALLRY